MKTDDSRRVILNTVGTKSDLMRHGIELKDGLKLEFYSDDADEFNRPDNLVSHGEVQFNHEIQQWVLEVDWDAIRNESQLGGTSGESKDTR